MPNWIEGNIRVRGNKNDLDSFIKTLEATSYGTSNVERIKNDLIECGYAFSKVETLYVHGTRRAFVEVDGAIYTGADDNVTIEESKENDYVLVLPIRQAWSFTITIENWIDIAKRLQVDIKLEGHESGMEFSQFIEIDRNGKLLKELTVQYDDWEWECPQPTFGG